MYSLCIFVRQLFKLVYVRLVTKLYFLYLFVRLLTSRALFPVYVSLVLPLYIFFPIPSVYLFVRLLTTIFSSSTFE